jgi:hypothetical protein
MGGMDGFDVGEARKVPRVEGENELDAVDVHGCDQAGVVNLDAGDAVINE